MKFTHHFRGQFYLGGLAHANRSGAQINDAILKFAFLFGPGNGVIQKSLEEVKQVALPRGRQAQETIQKATHILLVCICNFPYANWSSTSLSVKVHSKKYL